MFSGEEREEQRRDAQGGTFVKRRASTAVRHLLRQVRGVHAKVHQRLEESIYGVPFERLIPATRGYELRVAHAVHEIQHLLGDVGVTGKICAEQRKEVDADCLLGRVISGSVVEKSVGARTVHTMKIVSPMSVRMARLCTGVEKYSDSAQAAAVARDPERTGV